MPVTGPRPAGRNCCKTLGDTRNRATIEAGMYFTTLTPTLVCWFAGTPVFLGVPREWGDGTCTCQGEYRGIKGGWHGRDRSLSPWDVASPWESPDRHVLFCSTRTVAWAL